MLSLVPNAARRDPIRDTGVSQRDARVTGGAFCIVVCALLTLILSATARAQTVPFFSGGVVAFDPEVSVIPSGALLNATAVASQDRKYVTIGGGATNARLQSLQTFPVNVPQGFVGGISLPSGAAVNAVATNAGAASSGGQVQLSAPSPDIIERSAKSWVFTRQGMYLLAPLK
jgi:hypothetical protein